MTEAYSPLADYCNVRDGLPPRGDRGEELLTAMRSATMESPITEASLPSNEEVIFSDAALIT